MIPMVKRIVRVEPQHDLRREAQVPVSSVVVHAGLVYVSLMPPYDPTTGEMRRFEVAQQMELVLTRMQRCV